MIKSLCKRTAALLTGAAIILALGGCTYEDPYSRYDTPEITSPFDEGVEYTPQMEALLGRWEDDTATFHFDSDGWVSMKDEDGISYYTYTADENILTLGASDGDVELLYELSGDSLVLYNTKPYARVEETSGYGLVGTWYSEEDDYTFIFNADGTYSEYDEDQSYEGNFFVNNGHVRLIVSGYEDMDCMYGVSEDDQSLTLNFPVWTLTRSDD